MGISNSIKGSIGLVTSSKLVKGSWGILSFVLAPALLVASAMTVGVLAAANKAVNYACVGIPKMFGGSWDVPYYLQKSDNFLTNAWKKAVGLSVFGFVQVAKTARNLIDQGLDAMGYGGPVSELNGDPGPDERAAMAGGDAVQERLAEISTTPPDTRTKTRTWQKWLCGSAELSTTPPDTRTQTRTWQKWLCGSSKDHVL